MKDPTLAPTYNNNCIPAMQFRSVKELWERDVIMCTTNDECHIISNLIKVAKWTQRIDYKNKCSLDKKERFYMPYNQCCYDRETVMLEWYKVFSATEFFDENVLEPKQRIILATDKQREAIKDILPKEFIF